MSRTYKTEAFVLKRRNFGEADKLLTIFTKHYGKINCLAKGIRKLTSRKGGNLELFNLVSVFLAKGKNLDIISEVQTIDSYSGFRKDLVKVATAFNCCKLVDLFNKEDQANLQIFDLLKETLKKLENEQALEDLSLNFKIELLKASGFGLPNILNHTFVDEHISKIIEKKVKFFYV
ncbi:DNA repair protein RecO [Candidatus Beckwithbacteria bacterium RBG_13_35_6]|uniref:DNA repair protein RecO n=1 Tax=Candidatus Beckwithbacteria bacterium RBG_13_35_6 TaxID=1797456 RepID=A0A1F5DCE6_9BACT|nr:MAG: DNA repair protein RecO [Candidatus Beckwithbacteria bacterium RBG_13_35_6]